MARSVPVAWPDRAGSGRERLPGLQVDEEPLLGLLLLRAARVSSRLTTLSSRTPFFTMSSRTWIFTVDADESGEMRSIRGVL